MNNHGSRLEKLTALINAHKKTRFLIDIFFVGMFMLIIFAKFGFWMEGNDDNIIAYISSGHITKSPSPYLYFSNVIWGFLVSSLYRLVPGIPWYGLIQLILIFSLLLIPLHSIEQRCKSFISYCAVMVTGGVTILAALKMLVFVQFTTLSALLAISGYVGLVMYEKKSSKLTAFIGLELMAYLVRRASMLMIQPLGYTLFVTVTFWVLFKDAKKSDFWTQTKAFLKQVIPVFVIVLLIAGVSRGIDRLSYSSSEWDSALKIEDFRCKISDFYYNPEYSEVAHILDKYGIDECEYEAIRSTRTIETDRYVAPTEEIVEYLKANAGQEESSVTVWQMLAWVFSGSYRDHYDILILGILAIVVVALSDKPMMLGAYAFYIFGKLFTWGYIFFRQREVERVMSPLYYSEVVFLLCFLFVALGLLYSKENRRTKAVQAFAATGLCAYSVLSLISAKFQYSVCKDQSELYNTLYQVEQGIAGYCNDRSEDRFLISGEMTIYWKYPLLSTAYSGRENYTFLGGWFCPSPMAQEYLNEVIRADGPLYIAFTVDTAFEKANQNILGYLEQCLGYTPEYEGGLMTSFGEYGQIYKIKE